MSGGACFTPRLNPRPSYPPAAPVFASAILGYVRVVGLCTLATYVLHTPYIALVDRLISAGLSEQMVFTLFALIVHTACYVGINGFFFACTKFGWLQQYQFDRKPFQIPTKKLLSRTFFEAFMNQCVTGPVVIYFGYRLFVYFGMPPLTAALPSITRLCAGFAVSHFVNDWFFYWSHRTVHHPKLYGWIHKQHHTYIGSIGFAAEYASPLEQIISNQLPSIGGCLFFGCWGHSLVFFVWIIARLEQTYEAHSGFCFKGTLLERIGLTNAHAAAYHDYHHSGNQGNFGAEWCDWLFGTMDSYVQLGHTDGYIALCNKIGEEQRPEKNAVSKPN